MYQTLNDHYQQRFGCKVYKLSIDGGFTCPNRDGTVGTGGCVFCSGAGGGEFALRGNSIPEQLEQAKKLVAGKCKSGKYIAYFQAFTNTYGSVAVLEEKYRQALTPDWVVGLAIGTRPDCLPEEVIDLLARLNREKPVSVELGLQTIHTESVRYIRRGYDNHVYFDAVKRLKQAGIEVVTHIILGLPGETPMQMAQTTRAAVEAGTDGVKFHLLHVLENTALAEDFRAGKFCCLTMEEYADCLQLCLQQLQPETVVHRITGDGAKKNLIAPLWSADKKRVLNYLHQRLG